MSNEVISTAILTIATVVLVMVMINAIYPEIISAGASIRSTTSTASERIGTDIRIIQVSNTTSNVTVWLKNVGRERIGALELSDLFFGKEGDVRRVNYNQSLAGETWNYTLENGGDTTWDPHETLRVTINKSITSGTYIVKFTVPNGIYTKESFSV